MGRHETPIQNEVFSFVGKRRDATIFRNNVGFAVFPGKRFVKYGVCNPGGADLIGWRSMIVTQKMVGRRVALFLAIETKSKDKGPNKDQKNFLFQVKNAGGLSGVAKNETDAAEILDSYYS